MLRRASIVEILPVARWRLNAVWELERSRIEEFLEDEASAAYARSPNDVGTAKGAAPAAWQQIASTFPAQRIDVDLLARAKRGSVDREAGSWNFLMVLRIILATSMGLEVATFTARWAYGDAYMSVAVLGLLLAAAAWFWGWGLHKLNASLALARPTGRALARALSALAIASALIAGIMGIWAKSLNDGPWWLVTFTMFITLQISLLEVIYENRAARYLFNLREMFRAQVQFANEQHNMHQLLHGEKWMDQFRYAVDMQAQQVLQQGPLQESTP